MISKINLGLADNFVVLAKSGISTVPTSMIVGNIGVSPIASTAITGFSLVMDKTNQISDSNQVMGKVYAPDYEVPTPGILGLAIDDMLVAYTDAASRQPYFTELYTGVLGGRTLNPGVYKWGTGVLIREDITLQGGIDDIFIFQIAKGLTMANYTKLVLIGGVLPENVFWQVCETVDIGTGAHFEGTILAKTNISLGSKASVNGKLLSQTAVTLIQNTIK